ncbi:hypothetical protein [Thermanaeromonas toyohensis]|nr:hypothetical protein [Thermanaeromonas toyohensis]
MPLARFSYRWQKLYKKRTAVERVNSRLDQNFNRVNIAGVGKIML